MYPMRGYCAIAAVLVSGAALPLSGNAATESDQPGKTTTSAVALPDQIELPRLVDLCAQRLKLNLEYDPAVLKGASVTLRINSVMSDAELWELTNRSLVGRALTTIRQAGDAQGFTIVKLDQAASLSRVEDASSRAQAEPGHPQPGFQSLLVKVEHRSVKEILDGIKGILSKPGGAATEVPGTGSVGTPTAVGSGAGAPSTSGGAVVTVGGLFVLSELTPRIDYVLGLVARLDSAVETGVLEEVPLRHLSASHAAGLVEQMATRREGVVGRKPVGEILPGPGGDSLLIIAPADRVPYWRSLIDQLDRREGLETVSYTPHHFGLRDVAKLIEETVGDQSGSSSGTGLLGAAASGTTDDRLRIVVDDLTGTLVITTTRSRHAAIAELMTRLENVPAAARRPMRSYTLKNRPVKEIMAVLSQMLAAGVLEGEAQVAVEPAFPGPSGVAAVAPGDRYKPDISPTLPAKGAASQLPSPAAAPSSSTGDRSSKPGGPRAEPAISMSSDDATNTLIAVGEPRLLSQLEALLVTLDVRQPQVLLEVLLLTLSESDTSKLGIELDRLRISGSTQLRLSSLFGTAVNAGTTTAPAGGAGGTLTVLSPGEFSIVISALQELKHGRSLSMPRLLVSNNQKGDFNSTNQVPVSTTSRASNQDTFQGFSGYEQAGTLVSVQPQITEADHLLLQYNVTLSNFDSGGGNPPGRLENKLSSQVSIPDGHTIALGGIEFTESGDGVKQIPLLGSIPIIGEAFKSRSNSDTRTRFFVFIHAEIMRNTSFEDLKFASDVSTSQAGISDGLPVVKPQVMR